MQLGRCALAVVLFAAACDEGSPRRLGFERNGRLLHGDEPMQASSPREAAEQFLAERRGELDLDGVDLVFETERRGKAGTYVRYGQRARGLVVFDGQVIVLVDPQHHVRAVNLAHRKVSAAAARAVSVVGEARARAAAGAPHGASVVLGVAHDGAQVYHVVAGDTLSVVDAVTGAVRERRDLRRYVDGAGFVYDPNPVATSGNTALTDNNGATSPALDAQRIQVVLPRLDGTGLLRGPWVDARPKQVNKRANVPSLMYFYDRANADGHFEEVMAYYHLDRAQARIQALGFTEVNNRVQIANVNDSNQDNSFYSPQSKELTFGTGGVDDAEDADVILHEYGHAIHDNQVPGFGGGDEGAMGEGFGDYLAASFGDALSPQINDEYCVAEWDAVSYSTDTPPCLRRVDATNHWPEDVVGQVHDDGVMWSSALYAGRAVVGADVMDTLVLESHFLLSTNETFAAAANAILSADNTLYAGAHHAALRRAFVWQGLLRTITPPSSETNVLSSETVLIENTRTGGMYANNLDEVKTYTKAGAQALRVHFSIIDTQTGTGCAGVRCDNIYLYDAQGDLFQILGGNANDTLSVAIPGDTVRIRLVTNSTTPDVGYVIDRVDALGTVVVPPDAAIDAPIVIDAPPDAAIDAPSVIDAPPDAAIDAAMPDAAMPDAATPDAAMPDAAMPDAAMPDAAMPDAAMPDAPAPMVDAHVPAPDAPVVDDGDGGCGCRTRDDGRLPMALGLAGLVLARLRRKRGAR